MKSKVLKELISIGLVFIVWAIFVLTVMFSVMGICALITYLDWEIILVDTQGVIAFLSIAFGSFGFALFICCRFLNEFNKLFKIFEEDGLFAAKT